MSRLRYRQQPDSHLVIATIRNDLDELSLKYASQEVLGLYGSGGIAARYCSLDPTKLMYPGLWQHGWGAPHRKLTPEYEFGEGGLQPKTNYWLARDDQAEFLQENGYNLAMAIGLPCVYLPRSNVRRIPNSLIVVPSHSLEYTKHQWNFETYAQQISEFANDFRLSCCSYT